MWDWLSTLFDTSGFMPRWACGHWTAVHGWLHVASDVAVWAAYTAIPIALVYYILRRRDVEFVRIYWLFVAFILSCGAGHLIEAVIFWWPIYRVAGVVKLCTAIISLATFVAMVRMMPSALVLPGVARLNAELTKAKESAEASNRAKSEFLANMSHEIRTPLTAILGYADVLTEEGLDRATSLEAAATIKRNGKYLLDVINDILDLSKIEAGKMTFERILVPTCRTVADVASLLRVRAAGKGLSFSAELDGPVPEEFHSDPTRLRQILINLLGNAIKFTEQGSVRLVVRCVDAGTCNPKMQFDVIDTGIGMSRQQVATLFRPFSQGGDSTARKFGGSGLGLAISRTLTEMLGGRIEVESVVGHGSLFRVTIPAGDIAGARMLSEPSAAVCSAKDSPAGNAAESLPRLSGRILLAEDGPDNQRLIGHLLKKAGAEVTIAENGQIACRRVRQAMDAGDPFDLVLMDMQMPVLDGFAATARLRSEGCTTPIIAVTAHAMASDHKRCIDAGCDAYLAKPIDRAALITLLAEHLRRAGTDASMRPSAASAR